ncbi:MAG: hypothetical protein JXB49_37360 [Bacteroidales bacterium]|nr:hypothetical protein [Bacteroidales bacterium]
MRKIISLFILIVTLLSCETWDYYNIDDFNYGTDNHNIKLFINGGISSQYINHRIYLIKPGSFIDKTKSEPIVDANVFVVSDMDTFRYEIVEYSWNEYSQQYIELEMPYYQSIKKFSAIAGQEYVLHVEYNHEIYTATDIAPVAKDFDYNEIPLPYQGENSSEYYTNDNGDLVQATLDLSVKKHHFGFPNSCIYLWDRKKSVSDTLDYLNINAKSYVHQFADVQGVFANINYYTHFVGGEDSVKDTVVTILQTISDNYYAYLHQGFNETDWKESTFATISGNLPTNVSEGGAGFFYVSDLLKKEIIIEDLLKYDLN